MAATVLKPIVLLFVFSVGAYAQAENKDVYQQVSKVATSLTDANPAEAMDAFNKSFDGYGRLRDYFTALTNAYSLANEIEVTDEHVAANDATLTVHWVLTLTNSQTGFSESRSEDTTVKLALNKKGQWRIVGFTPLEFFNPELRKSK
jgi:hypothetical protein